MARELFDGPFPDPFPDTRDKPPFPPHPNDPQCEGVGNVRLAGEESKPSTPPNPEPPIPFPDPPGPIPWRRQPGRLRVVPSVTAVTQEVRSVDGGTLIDLRRGVHGAKVTQRRAA